MAINYAGLNSVYNYFLTSYAPKSDTKFDTHKRSELRGVYNSIVKMNTEAPLFIVDKSQETKEYAVGLKENARAFRNTIASLGGLNDDELLNKKVAASSNESLATATYIGEDNSGEGVPSFDLFVKHLATTQVNHGDMLASDAMYLPEDTYSFDIGVNGLNYEFQYNVTGEDTNRTIQNKLARLITNADIGLKADVLSDGNGNSALRIESVNTGNARSASGLMFTISDDSTSKTAGSVGYFGLNHVSQYSSNSEFVINGASHEASGNTFTVEKQYEITINRLSTSEEDGTHISLQADIDSMAINVSKLIEGYNAFVDTAAGYSENHPKSERLVREMKHIAGLYEGELSKMGVSVNDEGRLELDEEELRRNAVTSDITEAFDGLKRFAGTMLRKVNQVSLNPMEYAEKTIVAYKNPGHNYATPYMTSAYSGMMFNSYC